MPRPCPAARAFSVRLVQRRCQSTVTPTPVVPTIWPASRQSTVPASGRTRHSMPAAPLRQLEPVRFRRQCITPNQPFANPLCHPPACSSCSRAPRPKQLSSAAGHHGDGHHRTQRRAHREFHAVGGIVGPDTLVRSCDGQLPALVNMVALACGTPGPPAVRRT